MPQGRIVGFRTIEYSGMGGAGDGALEAPQAQQVVEEPPAESVTEPIAIVNEGDPLATEITS